MVDLDLTKRQQEIFDFIKRYSAKYGYPPTVGDIVVVRPQDTAIDGDVVVALVGEEATVKRFYREADHIRLQPENAAMEPIRSKEVKVLGRVVGLLRKVS